MYPQHPAPNPLLAPPSPGFSSARLLMWGLEIDGTPMHAHVCLALQEEQAALQRGGVASSQLEEEASSDAEESGDRRWRRIAFSSSTERWQRRLQSLRAVLQASGPEFGCWLDK